MSLISDLLNLVDSTIRNKSTTDRIDNIEDADLRAEIIANLQPDFNVTNQQDARYIKNKPPRGITLIREQTISSWSDSQQFTINFTGTALFVQVWARVTKSFTAGTTSYVPGDLLLCNFGYQSEDSDTGGMSGFIRGNTYYFQPKIVDYGDASGRGNWQDASSNEELGAELIVRIFGTTNP